MDAPHDSSPKTSQEGLDRTLLELERAQRREAPTPDAPVYREVSRVRIPEEGRLPQSDALLERLYVGDLVAKEKKPQVIDTRRCWGPYLASIDDEPMVLLDACSQIATLTHGFAHPRMLQGLYEGRFDEALWANTDTRRGENSILRDYAEGLIQRAPAGLEHVAFVAAGGAEANEKAFRIARMHAPGPVGSRRRVLAFQHGFHGRTWASLGATWNPSKRGPFELAGFEAVFAEPTLESLKHVLEERGEEIYAAIIEPMMAEGGDVHLTREFLAGVRELTRKHGIPLIADEVQTGFFTGGPFFWWRRLGLGETPETSPDLLTCAKKSGLGAVLSRWPDPEPTAVNTISALRGLIQLESAGEQGFLESELQTRVDELAGTFPHLVENPRVAGTTFAFDLPDADAVNRFIDQRFQRGFMTYQAGERAIRFRLSAGWTPAHLDDLFARVRKTLALIDDPSRTEWVAEGKRAEPKGGEVEIRVVREEDWASIVELEAKCYEPERRDDETWLRSAADAGVALVAHDGASGELLGFCVGGRIEAFRNVVGPDRSRFAVDEDLPPIVFYSADVTVAPSARGRGVGRMLKQSQLDWARARGYRFASGRNRVGHTETMTTLNQALGAYELARFDGQYGGDGVAAYYRIPLVAPQLPELAEDRPVDLADGLQAPFGPAPDFMATRELVGPAASRLNLSNWATIDTIHYAEHLREVHPRGCGHMYITSSRDELVDKGLRCLRLSRPEAQVALSLEGNYFGHNTAAARSLSDPEGFGEGFELYGWPKLPHPAIAGVDATVAAIEKIVAEHGSAAIFGLAVELVGERSGYVLDDAAVRSLATACRVHDIPFIVAESTTGGYRNGQGAWGVDAWPEELAPDMVWWYAGGQLGHIFVNDRYWIDKPLMLISTWDGDEVSVIRTHEALRAAWKIDLEPLVEALDTVVGAMAKALSTTAGGRGLYRTLRMPADRAARLRKAAASRGILLGEGDPKTVVLVPTLDQDADEFAGTIGEQLLEAAREVAADMPSEGSADGAGEGGTSA